MSTPAKDMYTIAYCDMGDDQEETSTSESYSASDDIEMRMQIHRDDARNVLETIEALNKEFSLANQTDSSTSSSRSSSSSSMRAKNQHDSIEPPVYMSTAVPMNDEPAAGEELPMWLQLVSWMSARKNKPVTKNINNYDQFDQRGFSFAPLKAATGHDKHPDQNQLFIGQADMGQIAATGGRKKLAIPTTIWLVLFLLALSSVFILIGISQVISILSFLQFRLIDISNQQKQLRASDTSYHHGPAAMIHSSDHARNHNHHHGCQHHRPPLNINSMPYDHNGSSWMQLIDKLKQRNQRQHLDTKQMSKHADDSISTYSRWLDKLKQQERDNGKPKGPTIATVLPITTEQSAEAKFSVDTTEVTKLDSRLWSLIISNVTLNKTLDFDMATTTESPVKSVHWRGHPYPHHATLWYSTADNSHFEYICGATLIDGYWLVTAAHCLDSYYGAKKVIAIGGAYRENFDQESYNPLSPFAVEVTKRVIHPLYDPEALTKSTRLPNDIALLKLGKIIDFPSDLAQVYPSVNRGYFVGRDFADQPILITYPQLANEHGFHDHNFIDQRCWIPVRDSAYSPRFKWSGHWLFSDLPTNYSEVDLPVLDNEKCGKVLTRRLGAAVKIGAGDFCAGGEKDRDACRGNGGNGLYCLDRSNTVVLKGINSWGTGCGEEGIPGVYTDVAYYKDWIDAVIF